MYQLNQIKTNNPEPWNITFARRNQYLEESLKGGSKICILLYERADNSTFRYRGYNLWQSTLGESEWKCVYFFFNELECIENRLLKVHLLSLTRIRWTKELDYVVKKVKANGIPVIFDVDDLIYDLDFLAEITNVLNVNSSELDYDFWTAVIGRIGMTASLATGFTTTNHFLGTKLQKKFGNPYAIIPNYLNNEQVDVSNIYHAEKRKQNSLQPFTIGYFSGTPTHIIDFNMVKEELISFLLKYEHSHLMVVGYMDFPDDMAPLLEKKRISFTPFVDFITLQHLIAQVDVNIAPLATSTFANCKSELKFFEAAIVDTVTLASPTYTFAKAIENGETGFLCKPGNWYETLEKIYAKEVDVNRINEKAREYVLTHYYGKKMNQQICSSYNELTNNISAHY